MIYSIDLILKNPFWILGLNSNKEELNKFKNNLQKTSKKESKKIHPLADVRDIWIFSRSTGISLFTYAPETRINDDLLGGFFTAIQLISVKLNKKHLTSMIVGDDRYSLYQETGRDFFILSRSKVKSPEESVKKILRIIYYRFWKEYSNLINNFKGAMKPFRRFKKIIESLDLTLEI